MSRPLPLLGKTHPLTGEPIQALGFRADGRAIWPMMGGDPSNDPPERPEDVPEDTWNALGDPGKSAIVRERAARVQAERERDDAVRQRNAAQARPTPPPSTPPKNTPAPSATPPAGGEQPDIASIVQQAVAAAIQPFQERETQRDAEQAANKVRDAVLDAAKAVLHDPTDALANVELASVVDDQGRADSAKVAKALEQVVAAKPHLAKSTQRQAPFGMGGGTPPATPDAEKVKSILGDMQRATGVRAPASGI